ncbi:hypothetical protein QMO56_24995 [Roseomonas sp. E05]|uniref:hypothetical protein n=1 Tax=Roseomonas sp. E05 TaxID=3046310 RepID=UPI0024BB13D4|nr:hypothetical protein [Roseomonas sp. E05]MDJ0391369.1 hypothetical protein [Roseomonas sp. E05]
MTTGRLAPRIGRLEAAIQPAPSVHVLMVPEGLQESTAATWRAEAAARFRRSDIVVLVELRDAALPAAEGRNA